MKVCVYVLLYPYIKLYNNIAATVLNYFLETHHPVPDLSKHLNHLRKKPLLY